MSVQSVGLNSQVLNKVRNIQPKSVEDNKPQTETVVEETKNEMVSDVEPEKKSHKVRNWSIGLSAAAVLIGLGVAGRKGKLGSAVEKALGGGAEKDAGKLADDFAGSGKADDGIVIDEISAEEFEQIKNSPKINVGGNKKSEPVAEVPKAEQPKVEQPKSETSKVEQPKAEQPKTEPKAEPKPEVPKAPTISQAEKDAINAKIDRTLPVIGEDLKSVKAPTVEDIEKMGYDFSKFELKAEPNARKEMFLNDGRRQVIRYDNDGNLDSVWIYSANDKYQYESWLSFDKGILKAVHLPNEEAYYYNPDKSLNHASKELGNNDLYYDNHGFIKRYLQKGENDTIIKDIDFFPGTGKIKRITYGANSYETERALKIENFDEKSVTPVQEIYIKDGQEIVA